VFAEFGANPPYRLISTYNSAALANPPSGGRAQNPNWNSVNWVLNNKPTNSTRSTWIVQQVIWKLLTGRYIVYGNPSTDIYPAPPPDPTYPPYDPAHLPTNSFSASHTAIVNQLYTDAL